MSEKTDIVPRVSIGLPVYNVETHIRNTLESILSQTLEDFELIISDNASDDGTEEICRSYAHKDARIRFFRNPTNAGAATNYNSVYYLSRGEYFKWAAGDDILRPNFLKRCVEKLDSDSSVVIAYPQTEFIDDEGSIIEEVPDPGWDLRTEDVAARLAYVISAGHWCNVIFGLIRHSALKGTRLIASFPGQDYGLLADLSLKGKFYEIPEKLFLRRLHSRASSQNTDLGWQLEFLDPSRKHKLSFPFLKRNWEHFTTVRKSDLPRSRKMELSRLILRQLRWQRHRVRNEITFAFMKSFGRKRKTVTYDLRKGRD